MACWAERLSALVLPRLRLLLVLIDNYDSFTFNLVQLFEGLGADVRVYRNDAIDVVEIERLAPAGLIVSPGPGRPEDAGVSLPAIRRFLGALPVLGVCLGHQCLALAYGARVVRGSPLHGRASALEHDGTGLFDGVPNPFPAARYHSLVVDDATIRAPLRVNARSEGAVMGIVDADRGAHGVQFHPESYLCPVGSLLAANFLALVSKWPTSLMT